jgi:hypothetical protein
MNRRPNEIVPAYIFLSTFLVLFFAAANCPAQQIKFSNWVASEEMDSATKTVTRQIGTFAADGNSSLWLAVPDSGAEQIQLTLKSKKMIASDYFSYRIDRVDNLNIQSAQKACNASCLTNLIPRNGDLIKNMRRGLRIQFEYDAVPDMAQKPTFSLRGFSKAYEWLLAE